jgi:hypothetical protein
MPRSAPLIAPRSARTLGGGSATDLSRTPCQGCQGRCVSDSVIFATSSSDDGIGACVSRALTKSPVTGHLAEIKYSVTIQIDETPGRTGFRGSGNDLNGYPPVGGLHRSVSACNPMQRRNDGTRRWPLSISRLCIRVGTQSRPRKSGWQRFTGVADSHRAPVPTRAHLRHTSAHPPEGVHPWPPPSPQAPRA